MSGPIPESRIGRLHVLTDEQLQNRFTHVELARLAALGGADVVQLREKRRERAAQLEATAREALAALAGGNARLIIDDRVDLVGSVGAAGVHLGRHDEPVARARELLGEAAIIGGTANSADEARRVAASPVDYIGVGPVYGTRSKRDPAPRLGLAAFAEIVAAVPQPVIAIGGITAEHVGELLAAGAFGVAVMSAVTCADDPRMATRQLRDALRDGLGSQGLHDGAVGDA